MSKVYTLLRYDNSGHLIEEQGYEYEGQVVLMKASQEEKDAARSSQAFTDTLRSMFQEQFKYQRGIMDTILAKVTPLFQNPQGFAPDALAAMRTNASEGITANYDAAQRNFQDRAFVLGGRELPSGALLAGQGAIDLGRARDEAAAQRQITLANEQQKQANFWNAANILNGQVANASPNNLLSGSIQQGQQSAAQLYQAFHPFFWDTFGQTFAKALGQGAAGAASMLAGGGAGALLPGITSGQGAGMILSGGRG